MVKKRERRAPFFILMKKNPNYWMSASTKRKMNPAPNLQLSGDWGRSMKWNTRINSHDRICEP